ncbi:hypothetical protein BTR23_23495 [Alkalihalophilus pseudofirmus]|nr:hypothetical protein BTR23_23495 [Alkalihalophilus pseudofirmus]
MSKQIIMLPHVIDKVKAEYFDPFKKAGEEFDAFLQRSFNPNNRGIITSQVGEQKDQTKVWGEHFSFICVDAAEGESIKAVSVKPTKAFQFQFVLETGYIIEGPWIFTSIKGAKQSGGNPGTSDQLTKEIEHVQTKFRKGKEYAEFEEYWNKLDIVNTYMAQSVKEQRDKSVTKYKKLQVDFDRQWFVLELDNPSWKFSTGDRIRICTNEAWLKGINVNNKDIGRVQSTGIGTVTKVNGNKRLVIESYNTDLLKNLFKDKGFQKGHLWVDDVGNRNIVNKQKEALQKLFNEETANPDLKVFIPDVNLLMPEQRFTSWDGAETNFTKAQKEAIEGALSGNDIYLIQGPPGTGKTTVISEIIQTLVKENKKVLLSSQTHLAVDNVLQKIGDKEGVRAIRIGNEEKIELDCERYSLSNRVSNLQEEVMENVQLLEDEQHELSKDIEGLTPLLQAHLKVENELSYMINLLEQINNKESELNQIVLQLDEIETELLPVKNKVNAFLDKGDVNQLKRLYETINRKGRDVETFQEGAILSHRLQINRDDFYKINVYNDMVEEWQRLAKEEESLSKQLAQLIENKRSYEQRVAQKTNRFNQLIDLGAAHHYEELSKLEKELEFQRFELNDAIIQANGMVKEREAIQETMESLYQEAMENQAIIDQYIQSNAPLWKELYTKASLKKSEFLACVSKKQEFERTFTISPQELESFSLLSEYEQYMEDAREMEQLTEASHSIQEQKQTIEKYVKSFSSSLAEYKNDGQITEYLDYYRISIETLTKETEQSRIKRFVNEFKTKEHKLALLEKTGHIRSEWTNQLNYYQDTFEDIYIKISNLIGATCLGISSNQNNYFLTTDFDYVVIDEAARSSSLELLIPMVRGKKIILVGDHKQISPQLDRDIMLRIEKDFDFSDESMNALFKESLFGLMYDRIDGELKTFLNEQFRMDEQISTVVSKYFYNGELKDGYNIINKSHSLEANLPDAFYWVDTLDDKLYREQKPPNGTSYWNEGEVQITKNILFWLDDHLTSKKEVGVIAPYREQKQRLLDEVGDIHFENIELEINTVDAFQGREKNIIIMNLVRNNDVHSVGHTANYARINVALSRAQELMFLVGNQSFITNNKSKAGKLHQVLQHLKRRNNLLDEPFFSAEVSKG